MRKLRKVCSFIIIVNFLCQSVVFGTPERNSTLRLPVGETYERLDETAELLQRQGETGANSKQVLASMETAQTSLVDLVSKEAKEVEAVKSLKGSCVMNALLAWRLRHNPDLEVDVVKKSGESAIHYYLLVTSHHSKMRFIVDIFSPEYTVEYIMSGHVKVLVLPIDEAAQFSKWYKGYKKCDEKELQFLSSLIKKDGTEKSSLASMETVIGSSTAVRTKL